MSIQTLVHDGSRIYLVGREALPIFDDHLKFSWGLLYLNGGWPTQVAVGKIAVTKRQRIDRMMVFVIDRPIVHETTNAPSLQFRCQYPKTSSR